MATKPSASRRRRRRRGRLVASGASAIWRRRRRRVLALAVGCAVVLALSVPYIMGGWTYLFEQAVTNLLYAPNVEIRARQAGEQLAKRRRGMTERQLTLAFDRRVKNLKDPVSKEPISGTLIAKARRAFIRGYKGKKQ